MHNIHVHVPILFWHRNSSKVWSTVIVLAVANFPQHQTVHRLPCTGSKRVNYHYFFSTISCISTMPLSDRLVAIDYKFAVIQKPAVTPSSALKVSINPCTIFSISNDRLTLVLSTVSTEKFTWWRTKTKKTEVCFSTSFSKETKVRNNRDWRG